MMLPEIAFEVDGIQYRHRPGNVARASNICRDMIEVIEDRPRNGHTAWVMQHEIEPCEPCFIRYGSILDHRYNTTWKCVKGTADV